MFSRLRTILGHGSKRHALLLIPGTAIPGLAAFVGLVVVDRVAGSTTAGLLSLGRVASGFGAAMLAEGPSLAALRALANGHDRVAALKWAVLSRAVILAPLTVAGGLLIMATTGSSIGKAIVLGAVLLGVDAFVAYETSVLKAEGRFARSSALSSVQAVAAWTAAVVAASTHHSFAIVGGAYLAGDIAAAATLGWRPLSRMDEIASTELRGLWSTIVRVNLAGYALNNGDQYVIAAIISPGAVALYAIAYQLAGGAIALFSEPIAGALGPRIVRGWTAGGDGRREARRLARLGAGAELGIGAATALGIGAADAVGLLGLLSKSSKLAPVAMIIAVASALHVAASLAFTPLLFAARRESTFTRATAITAGGSIVAVPALTAAFGVIGAAVATLLGYLLLAGILGHAFRQLKWAAEPPPAVAE